VTTMASDRDTQIARIAAMLNEASKTIPSSDLDPIYRRQTNEQIATRLYDAGLRAEPDAGAGPLIRWAAAHLRGEGTEGENVELLRRLDQWEARAALGGSDEPT
jgi:hypothetical protein